MRRPVGRRRPAPAGADSSVDHPKGREGKAGSDAGDDRLLTANPRRSSDAQRQGGDGAGMAAAASDAMADPQALVSAQGNGSRPDEGPAGDAGGSRSFLPSLARGGALNLVGGLSNGLLTFALAIVITRALGTGGAGAFFEAIALLTILETAAELGADVGIVRTISRYLALGRTGDIRRSLKITFWPVLVASIAAATAMFVYAPALADLFSRGGHEREIAGYIKVLAPFLPISVLFTLSLAATRGFGTMVPNAVLDKMAKPALQPLIAIFAAVAGIGVVGFALAWTLPITLGCLASVLWLRKLLRRAERRASSVDMLGPPRPLGDLAREFWRFSAPRALSSVFKTGIDRLAILLVGALASVSAAGIYTASIRYLAAGQFASLALMQAMGPKISELLARKKIDDAGSVYQISSAWSVVLTWPVYLTLAGFAPFLLEVFGQDFVEGQTAMVIVAGAMLLSTAIGPVDVVLLMGGKSSWNLLNTLAALAINIALNVILVPKIGLAGAGIAFFASVAVNNLLPLAEVWMFMRLHPFGVGFLRATIAATVCYGGVGLLVRHWLGMSIPTFLLYGVVATSLYLPLLWRFRKPLELTALRHVVRRGKASGKLAPASPTR